MTGKNSGFGLGRVFELVFGRKTNSAVHDEQITRLRKLQEQMPGNAVTESADEQTAAAAKGSLADHMRAEKMKRERTTFTVRTVDTADEAEEADENSEFYCGVPGQSPDGRGSAGRNGHFWVGSGD